MPRALLIALTCTACSTQPAPPTLATPPLQQSAQPAPNSPFENKAPNPHNGPQTSDSPPKPMLPADPPPAPQLTSFTHAEFGPHYSLIVAEKHGYFAPTTTVSMPHHHATRIDWLNLAEFPQLRGPQSINARYRFTFAFESRDIRKVPNRHQWRTTYRARIKRVEPLP